MAISSIAGSALSLQYPLFQGLLLKEQLNCTMFKPYFHLQLQILCGLKCLYCILRELLIILLILVNFVIGFLLKLNFRIVLSRNNLIIVETMVISL